jgi:hypothetical protein
MHWWDLGLKMTDCWSVVDCPPRDYACVISGCKPNLSGVCKKFNMSGERSSLQLSARCSKAMLSGRLPGEMRKLCCLHTYESRSIRFDGVLANSSGTVGRHGQRTKKPHTAAFVRVSTANTHLFASVRRRQRNVL